MNKRFELTTLLLAALVAMPLAAAADIVAQDDAGDPAYDAGFDPGMDGGTGFGGWDIFQEANSGRFIGDSNNNGFGVGTNGDDVNTTNALDAHVAWGLYASTSNLASATRPFDAALVPGSVFSFSIDSGFIDTGSSVGMNLQNSSSEDLFQLRFSGGDPSWKTTDLAGDTDIGVGFSSDGFDVVIELTSATTYSGTMTQVSDTPTTPALFSGTFSAPSGGGDITQVRFYNFNAGSGSTNDMYFNKLVIDSPTSRVVDWVDLN